MRALAPTTFPALVADPVGHYAYGPCWLYAYFDDALSAIVLWGTLRGDDLAALVGHPAVPVTRGARGHKTLVDARRVENVEPSAFASAATYLGAWREGFAAALARLAIVEGGALPGVVAHGFFRVVEPAFEVGVFPDADHALDWLAIDDAADLCVLLDRLWREVAGVPDIIRDLRALLARDLVGVSLASAARGLGVSVRTLQRRLQDASTSFQHELDHVRLATAKRRMVETDDKLDAIAIEVGYGSGNHLATLFHRVEGCSPTEWRRRQLARS